MSPSRLLLGDHGGQLSSRVLLRPTDPERSRVFYRDTLGLAIYREFGSGPERGTVFFLGGGFLELSGRAAAPPAPGMALWLQRLDPADEGWARHATAHLAGIILRARPERNRQP